MWKLKELNWKVQVVIGGPKDHIDTSIQHSGYKAQDQRGIPKIMVCRILMFMLSLGPL